jgi:hypothetical protein
VVYHVKTEVEKATVGTGIAGKHGADGKPQFVENAFVNDAVAVNNIVKQHILMDGLQVFVCDIDTLAI